MSIPHDYYDGHRPELRSRGNSRHYIDPDYIANEADDQLPLISTIGRGPRGHGLIITNVVDEAGDFSFTIRSDFDGEVLHRTGNLSAGVISVSAMPADPVAGETVSMDVAVTRGPDTQHFTVPIPAGSTGSRIYCVSSELTGFEKGKAFQAQVSDLMVYGYNSSQWDNMPVPRVNDVAVFKCDGRLCLGTIEAVENGMAVFTSQVGFDVLQKLAIGDNGHWLIDGEDTGVTAQGAPGRDGESAKIRAVRTDGGVKVTATDVDGTTEAVVRDGADGFSPTIVSTDTPTGVRLEITDKRGSSSVEIDDGTDGRDGLPAIMKVRSTTETQQPYVNVQRTDADGNVYSMDFGLPRGADGKSIDIQGGVYKIDQLPDFDSTPVNRAFIVSDYEENEDYRYDLYIRGIDPVIAEEGGPWTVVEDWQGMPGFSIRYIHDIEIDADTPVQVADGDIEATFVPSAHIADGDLVLDDHGCLGVIGSATDGNGYVTVTYVTKLQVHWDDVLDRPSLVSTDSIELTESDGTVKADLKVDDQGYFNGARSQGQDIINIMMKHSIEPDGLAGHCIPVDDSHFDYDPVTGLALSDSVKESLAKADSAVQGTELSAAIQAEASAREKADQLLETEIDGKLGPEDIVAGKNISVTHDPVTGHVTIENTMKLTDSVSGLVAHGEDAYAQKPIEVRVKGKTWVNRWPVLNQSDGTVTTDETGLITIKATPEQTLYVNALAQGIAANKTYTLIASNSFGASNSTWTVYVEERDAAGAYIKSQAIVGSRPSFTFTTAANCAQLYCMIVVYAGYAANNIKTRIMLVDGTEAPDCFTPPASIASVETGKLVTAGKNLCLIDLDGEQYTGDFGATTKRKIEPGMVAFGLTLTNYFSTGSVRNWSFEDGTLSFECMGSGYGIGFGVPCFPGQSIAISIGSGSNARAGIVFYDVDGTFISYADNVSSIFTTVTPSTARYAAVVARSTTSNDNNWTSCQVSNIQLELGSTATAHEPPAVTTTPLPEVELRGLPNGTCDELVIKADGTCEVDKRLATLNASDISAITSFTPADAPNKPYVFVLSNRFESASTAFNDSVISDTWPSAGANLTMENVYRTWNGLIFVSDEFTDRDTALSIIKSRGGTFVFEAPDTTEPQSPVTLPALPAPTFNQYHDADIPSETSVEFLTEEAEVLTRFLMPGNIKAGSNVSVDVDGNDVTVSSSGGGGAGGDFSDPASDEDFDAYIGLN